MAKKTPVQALQDVMAFKSQIEAIEECEVMAHYAQSQGTKIPSHILKQITELNTIKYELEIQLKSGNIDQVDPRALNLATIGEIHGALARILAPATPATVLLLERNKRKGFAGMLGPVPLVRRLNILTILCLFTFLGLFFIDGEYEVNSYTINGDILSYPGWKFVFNELVIVSIAALGASFYALFEVYKYIAKNSYDPKFDSIYWIRFVLGIVSGVILAQFIFISPEILNDGVVDPADEFNKAQELGGFMTYKPLLAFLGGFSARVVHKILNSMVESLETFISGSTRDMVAAREASAKVKMEDKLNSIKQKNAATSGVEKMKATMQIMQLKEELNKGATSDEINAKLTQMMNDFMKPVGGVDVTFSNNNNTAPTPNPSVNVPIVEDYNPAVNTYEDQNNDHNNNDNYDQPLANNDVDQIDVPDFPEDMDNPDFPMPGDIEEDFDPNDPNLKV